MVEDNSKAVIKPVIENTTIDSYWMEIGMPVSFNTQVGTIYFQYWKSNILS